MEKLRQWLIGIVAGVFMFLYTVAEDNPTTVANAENTTVLKCEPYELRAGYANHGIGVYKYHNKPATWGEAVNICKSEGAHLAIVNSQQEVDLFMKFMSLYPRESRMVKSPNYYDSLFIGMHSHFNDWEYLTIEGKPYQSTGYAKWGKHQPNGRTQHCGGIEADGLYDLDCHCPAAFVCEMNIHIW